MNIRGTWQRVAAAGLTLAAVVTGSVRGDFAFGTPVNLGPQVNSSEREHDPCISADGLELYFQSYRPGGYGGADLYVATRATVADEWQIVRNLGSIVNTATAESGPSLSTDGLTLYFNSNRPGGYGGHDLYMTVRASRSEPWGKPVNLGPAINSPLDEINPNISGDGLSLYFADVEGDGTSVRPGGQGHADIWVSTRASLSDPWGIPVNPGAPVNSASLDGSPDLSHDGLLLFFNHWRDGNSQAFFDICVAARRTPQDPWGPPVNLGAPINGSNWDGNADLAADGRTLYFVSCCRPGGFGTMDIWQVSIGPIVDFNGDGKVDAEEVRLLTAHWGQEESRFDIGPTPFGDGVVDMHDMAVLTQYASQKLVDPTLIACWEFDETDGIAICNSAETYPARLVGNPIWRPAGGAVGGAIELDGADDYVAVSFQNDLPKGPLSVFAWVKGGKPGQAIFSQRATANWLAAETGTGALMTDLRTAGRLGCSLGSPAVITDGQWHRVGVVCDGVNRTLYVDGVPVAEDVQGNLKIAYADLTIGAGKDLTPGSFWSGLIDDVRIYSRVIKP